MNYKNIAKLVAQNSIKPALTQVYVSPTHTWVTNSYYVVRVRDEHPEFTKTHAIPAYYVTRNMQNAVLTENQDGTLSGTNRASKSKRAPVEILTPPAPEASQEELDKIINAVDMVAWDKVATYTDETTEQMPECSATYLSDLIAFIGNNTKDKFGGVKIKHNGKGNPIHISSSTGDVEAVLMPFNK